MSNTTLVSLSDFPEELLLKVFLCCNCFDILRLRQVSKYLKNITKDRVIWKGLVEKYRRRDIISPAIPRQDLSSYSSAELEQLVLRWKRVRQPWIGVPKADQITKYFKTLPHFPGFRSPHSILFVPGGRWLIAAQDSGEIVYLDLSKGSDSAWYPLCSAHDTEDGGTGIAYLSIHMVLETSNLDFILGSYWSNDDNVPTYFTLLRVTASSNGETLEPIQILKMFCEFPNPISLQVSHNRVVVSWDTNNSTFPVAGTFIGSMGVVTVWREGPSGVEHRNMLFLHRDSLDARVYLIEETRILIIDDEQITILEHPSAETVFATEAPDRHIISVRFKEIMAVKHNFGAPILTSNSYRVKPTTRVSIYTESAIFGVTVPDQSCNKRPTPVKLCDFPSKDGILFTGSGTCSIAAPPCLEYRCMAYSLGNGGTAYVLQFRWPDDLDPPGVFKRCDYVTSTFQLGKKRMARLRKTMYGSVDNTFHIALDEFAGRLVFISSQGGFFLNAVV